MSPLKKELQARAGDLTDVTIRKSKFSPATAFWRGKKEFAYLLRTKDAIEIRLTAEEIKTLRPDYRLERNRKDWVLVHFESDEDLDYVMGLVEKAYKIHK